MFKKLHPPVGARPGTLVVPPGAAPPVIRVMSYSASTLREEDDVKASDTQEWLSDDTVTWVDVQGLGDEAVLQQLAKRFSIHALALEDVVNVPQRPKSESYGDHQHIIIRMFWITPDGAIDSEQLSIFVGDGFVLTFQERPGDIFDPVRTRIRRGGGRLREFGADYLAYALIDAVIDGYYPVAEALGERLEMLEDQAALPRSPDVVKSINQTKRDLLALRRAVWPQREAITSLIREEDGKFSEAVRLYLRDCYDHCVQILDVIDTYREIASGLVDLYLSIVGHRQNEVMKILTIMASIFIPLTFMAGIYGMNFDHMPELHSRNGYFILLGAMVGVALVMIFYFWRKGWIGASGQVSAEESK